VGEGGLKLRIVRDARRTCKAVLHCETTRNRLSGNYGRIHMRVVSWKWWEIGSDVVSGSSTTDSGAPTPVETTSHVESYHIIRVGRDGGGVVFQRSLV
jgi:hypothetical protein